MVTAEIIRPNGAEFGDQSVTRADEDAGHDGCGETRSHTLTQLQAMGAALRRLRELAGLSGAEAKLVAGVNVLALERLRHRPRRATVERCTRAIADVLVADVLELGADAFAPPAEPDNAAAIERRRDRQATSVRAVRARRDLRRALETHDPAAISAALERQRHSQVAAWVEAARIFANEQENTDAT